MEFKKLGCSNKAIENLNKLYKPEGGSVKPDKPRKSRVRELKKDLLVAHEKITTLGEEISKILDSGEILKKDLKKILSETKEIGNFLLEGFNKF